MLLTLDPFTRGTIKIPGAKATPNGADQAAEILLFVKEKEKEILIQGLGVDLYDQVSLAVETDIDAASEEIKRLVNGHDYQSDGLQVRWEGLAAEPSLAAYYAYSQWVISSSDMLSDMGVVRPEAKNTYPVNAQPRYAEAYNEFLKRYQGGEQPPRYIRTLNGWGIDWYGYRSNERSLMQFLEDFKDDYPTANFTPMTEGESNSWGV